MGCCVGCYLAVAPTAAVPTVQVVVAASSLRWTAAAWRAAHQDFQWRQGDLPLPNSFQSLLRHVDMRAVAGSVPLTRLFMWHSQLPCTLRVREFVRQVRVLEAERALLYKTLATVENMRYHSKKVLDLCASADVCAVCVSADTHGLCIFIRQCLDNGRFDKAHRVIEGAISLAEVELGKLGFAFAVAMQSRK